MKKILLITGSMLLGVSSAWATVVFDDFNRTNTGMDRFNPMAVGSDWVNGDNGATYWGIVDNEVDAMSPNWDQVLYNTATMESCSWPTARRN